MKIQDGQTLADVAIQEYGSLEAVVQLAHDNDICISEDIRGGTELKISKDISRNRQMQSYCKVNAVSPATRRDRQGVRLGIFTIQFTKQFQ